MEKETRPIRCPHCAWEWSTRSKRIYTSCPNCHYNVLIRKNLSEPSPFEGLEHFNLDENGVKINDKSLATEREPNGHIVDIYFKRGKAWCEYDNSSDCKHVQFALSLPIVKEILKKKGWKT